MSNIQTINFNNQQLLTVEKDGIKYVAVKPICENLGLDWSSQRTKIKDNHILGSVMVIITTTGSDNKNYEMSCLPIDYINGWLFTINPNKVSEEIRPVVLYYQRECYKALLAHWKAMRELSCISYKHPEGLVFSLAGTLYTTSQALSFVSNKEHFHILRDIENEIRDLEMNPNLDVSLKSRILNGFKKATYKDSRNRLKTCYHLSEEAFLQMSLKYSSEVRARFVIAFIDYRDTLLNLYKARIVEKVIPQLSTSRSFVYIIREEGNKRFKVGVSNNPEKRSKTLQTGSPEDLTLIYTSMVCSNSFEIESSVHKEFKEYLLRGEWFDPSLNVADVILFLESQKYVLESDFELGFGSKCLSESDNFTKANSQEENLI